MNNSKIKFPNEAELLKAIANCKNAKTDLAARMYVLKGRLQSHVRATQALEETKSIKENILLKAKNHKERVFAHFHDLLEGDLELLIQCSINAGILNNSLHRFEYEAIDDIEYICAYLFEGQIERSFSHMEDYTDFAKRFLAYAKENFAKVSPEFIEED